MTKQKKTKGFKWNKFFTATTQKVLDDAIMGHIIYGGNFFLELVLPNALKLNSFIKLKVRLEGYVKSHGGKYPEQILINHRQLKEYQDLFPLSASGGKPPVSIPTFQGIIMRTHNNKRAWLPAKEMKFPIKYAKTNSSRDTNRIS